MTVLDYRPPQSDQLTNQREPWLGWAVYVAMSWTWCIGMFLPVLLVRDYGVWAWVVFAVPNIVGAGAVGWRYTRGDSAATAAAHRPMIVAFSFITCAYQIFFGCWAFSWLTEWPSVWGAGLFVLSILVAMACGRGARWSSPMALMVAAISVVCAWEARFSGQLLDPTRVIRAATELPTVDVAYILPVTCFGFLLCPHLDVTFHRAQQHLGRKRGRYAFGLGFGAVFPAMITFSLLYSWIVAGAMEGDPKINLAMSMALAVYFLCQLAFTIGVHWQLAEPLEARPAFMRLSAMAALTTVAGVLAWVLTARLRYSGLSGSELAYRLFLAAYGLIFPAYVWLCLIPGRGRVAPNRRQVLVCAIAVLLAAPMYWMGFIERKAIWLVPAVTVVLLARLLVRKPDASTPAESKPLSSP